MTVYINQNFDSTSTGSLPTGWTASGDSTITVSNAESYSGSNSLEFASSAAAAYAFAGDYNVTDGNYGNNQVECKFYTSSVSGSSQIIGLFLRATSDPSGNTMPNNAILFYGSMVSGDAWVLASTNTGGTVTTAKSVTLTSIFSAATWYRAILAVTDWLSSDTYIVSLYIQRMSDGAWLQESGSWGTAGDVQVPFMNFVTAYSFMIQGGQGLGPQVYDSGWGTGTVAGIITKLASGEVMYVDDFIWQDVPATTGNIPANPPAAGNEVELLASATSASDGGQTGHTGSNLNTADSNFAAYYLSAATYAGEFNQYAQLDAGSGNTVVPTAVIWSPGYGSDATFKLGGLETFAVGMIAEAGNSTTSWTQLGVNATNMFPRVQCLTTLRLDYVDNTTAYRYFRLRAPFTPCCVNQFRLLCTTASIGSASCRPARPIFSPAAGRYVSGKLVTITSNTGSVGGHSTAIYYTVGTRTSPPATPTTSSTLYSGPFAIPANGGDETQISAIAYNTGCTTATSAVVTAHFVVTPNTKVSLSLNGSTGYATIPSNSSIASFPTSGAWMCWVNVPAEPSGYTPFIDKEDTSASCYYLGVNNNGTHGQVYFGFNAGAHELDYAIPSTAWYGVWHGIVGRWSGTQLLLYIDGVSVGTPVACTVAPPTGGTTNLSLGFYNGSSPTYYDGLITYAAIFNTDPGATACAALSAGTALPLSYSPVGFWPIQDKVAMLSDLSGNDNHLQLFGGFSWSSSAPSAIGSDGVLTNGEFVSDTGVEGTTWFSNGSLENWPSDWYDTTGYLLSCNNAHCFYDTTTVLYWLIGGNMSSAVILATSGANDVYYRGHNWYSSTDLLNWTFQGQFITAIPSYSAAALGGNLVDRVHVLLNPSPHNLANKYCYWANVGEQTAGYAGCYTASQISVPAVYQTAVQPNGIEVADCNLFYDSVDDGTSSGRNVAYFVWTETTIGNIYAVQLNPANDWTGITGSNTELATHSSHGWAAYQEAPILFKYPFNGSGYYYLLSSEGTAYGTGASAMLYASATTLAGINSASAVSIYPYAPQAGTVPINAQSTCIFQVNGLQEPGFIFMMDLQDPGDTSSPINMINWRMAWYPISTVTSGNAYNAFPSAGTLSIQTPAVWDTSFLPAAIVVSIPSFWPMVGYSNRPDGLRSMMQRAASGIRNVDLPSVITINVTMADSPSTSDSLVRRGTFTRTQSDSPLTTDALGRTGTWNRSNADSPLTSDTLARSGTFGRTMPDSPLTTDALTRQGTFGRMAADTPLTTDALARAGTFGRTATDAPLTTDSLVRSGTFSRTMTDAPLTTDTLTQQNGLFRTMGDAPLTTDILTRLGTFGRTTSDVPLTTDALARVGTFHRTATDAPLTTDSVSGVATIIVTMSDAPLTTDALTRQLTLGRTASDAPATTDVLIASISIIYCAMSDAPVTVDALTRTGIFNRTIGDAPLTADMVTVIVVGAVTPFRVGNLIGGFPPGGPLTGGYPPGDAFPGG
jgi:hypothetical protein